MKTMNEPFETGPEVISRREVITELFALAAACAVGGAGCTSASRTLSSFYQKHFKEMSKTDLEQVLTGWEAKYKATYKKDVSVRATSAQPGVLFGYALDISRCIGCRRCVYACVDENNQSRDPQLHWITVLEMEKAKGIDFHHANAYYNPPAVPQPDNFYLPVACQQCENPPCVKVCPVEATWKEPDGIVVIDYDWCIGCRCCITACPYGARRFNWGKPSVPSEKLNTQTEYLGNRPRPKGVVEKCTFCLQRARNGQYPACVEVCPVGARKFGNLLDPNSEIRQILAQKRVSVLKEELNTQPKFFYFYSS
jgi:Fe-S-cluster-containing dehydrogenase component